MQHIPRLDPKEVEENHKHFTERISLYKDKYLDFIKSREFILKKAYPLQGNILEIGAGTGHTTLALAKAGYNFVSIDKDEEALKTAALNLAYEKMLSSAKFYTMDAKSLTFKSRTFKNIVCVSLFHHIDEIDKVLSEIDRVLCAGGKVVLADFNEKGMAIINNVHRQEGRVHENSNIGRDYIYSYFHGLGYEIKDYEDGYHWLLIAEKLIQK